MTHPPHATLDPHPDSAPDRPSPWLRRAIAGAAVVLVLLLAASKGPQFLRGWKAGGSGDAEGSRALVRDLPDPVEEDWAEVVARDTLRALFVSNSTSYFLYRGEAMGFEFRTLRRFAQDHDLELQAIVVRDRTELLRRLNAGEGDVVAARLAADSVIAEHVGLTRPLYETEPTIVQRDGPIDTSRLPEAMEEVLLDSTAGPVDDGVLGPGPQNVHARLLRRPEELGGEEVHLPNASPYVFRLVELSDSLGEVIEIVELDEALNSETVIREVARGDVQYTVAPENVAELREAYFGNLAIKPVVAAAHGVSWAVRTTSEELRERLDAWIAEERDGYIEEQYQTYFVDRNAYLERVVSEYLTSETGRLSPFDSLLARYASELDWDWRLLASQAFQESRFDPRARSWAGAQGILQLMPGTARDMGVANVFDPEENIRGAVRYLAWLDERWSEWIPDPDERLRFILASYNAGTGHVEDARRLTEKYEGDPDRWDDVAYWLLNLAKRKWNTDPVVRFGYARGLEPVTYVSLILERFEHYVEFVDEQPDAGAVATARADRPHPRVGPRTATPRGGSTGMHVAFAPGSITTAH